MFGEVIAVLAVFVVFTLVVALLGLYVWLVDRSLVAGWMRALRERWESRDTHPLETLAAPAPEPRKPHRARPTRLPRRTAAPEFTTSVATETTPAQRFAAYTAWTTSIAERTPPGD